MSDVEKLAQIGEAMVELEERKRSLAHLTAKIDKVKQAYRTFALQGDRWQVYPGDVSRVCLAHPAAEERGLGDYLLGQSELAAVFAEYVDALSLLRVTKERLAAFGISNS